MPPETVDLSAAFAGRRVLVTGHSGFKGSWLVTWLLDMGALVTGLSLPPPRDDPALFTLLGLRRRCRSHFGDIRDLAHLRRIVRTSRPELVFHLAAQPLVRHSYEIPLETFDVNVRGTATLLEAIRLERLPCAVVVVTSDKCYQNREWSYAYREDDALGGHDPYSASKAAAELVVESYRRSFFSAERLADHGVAVATARAGNVIGGGDWGHERLVPMLVAALGARRPIELRAPNAVRPWQHVLEPLAGYLELGARLAPFAAPKTRLAVTGAWNFGPSTDGTWTVRELVDQAIQCWGSGRWRATGPHDERHEAKMLRLATDKALTHLTWRPRWELKTAVAQTISWYRAFQEGLVGRGLLALTRKQIEDYESARAHETVQTLRLAS